MFRQEGTGKNCTSHVIQPLLEDSSVLWQDAAGGIPVLLLQNVKVDKGFEGNQVVSFCLTHDCLQPQFPVPSGRFAAELVEPIAWDSRCLDLGRPSIYFTASLAPDVKQVSAVLAEGQDPVVLPWTATTPSVVTWLLPKAASSATFDTSTKFCFGLQVRLGQRLPKFYLDSHDFRAQHGQISIGCLP
jgi:hypothetical protein